MRDATVDLKQGVLRKALRGVSTRSTPYLRSTPLPHCKLVGIIGGVGRYVW